ncbi:hypothetical protein Scep_014506 [Stephania cephalantha]|uniref:Uncharacterized protein n=1 Tax=Stephania cephalantha TaxID=152367 RepID=A0AAP0J250_9MAGN
MERLLKRHFWTFGDVINVMHLSFFKRAKILSMNTEKVEITLENGKTITVVEMTKNVRMYVTRFIYEVDLYILDTSDLMEHAMILARPFMDSANMFIDVKSKIVLIRWHKDTILMQDRKVITLLEKYDSIPTHLVPYFENLKFPVIEFIGVDISYSWE